MALERTDKNFDIDAITRLVDADANASPMDTVMRNAVPATEQDQPAELTPQQQRAVDAILDIVEEFAANRSAGSGNELEAMLVTNIAAKLPAGVTTQIVSAIYMEVERRDRTGFAEFGSEQWERVKKEAKDERERLDKVADMADDLQNAAQQQAQWSRDEHSLGGVTMTGEEWGEMGNEFRNNPIARQWLIAKLMRDKGMTQQQAEQKATEYADTFTAMSKPESMRTSTEKALVKRAESDPVVGEISQQYQASQGGAAYPTIDPTVQMSKQATTVRGSVSVGSAMLDAPPPATNGFQISANDAQASTLSSATLRTASVAPTAITGAPPIRDHFRAAHDAQTDNAPQPETPQPVITMPTQSADAGLSF